MQIEALLIKRSLQGDIEEIARAMLAGVGTWDDYLKLVGHGKACVAMLDSIAKMEASAAQAQGQEELPGV